MNPDVLIGLVAVPTLLLVNAALVAAEIAIVTVRRAELEEVVRTGRSGAAAARTLAERLDRTLAVVQVGITAIGLLLGWLGESSLADALRPYAAAVLPAWHGALAHALAGGALLALLTALQVVLGELAPKAVALHHPLGVALVVSRPLLALSRALAPVVWALNGAAAAVLRLVGIRQGTPAPRAHSVKELAALVEETRRAGELKASQADVVQNVFRLSGKRARDIMVPLDRVGMLDLRWPAARALDGVLEGAHTRLPVFDGERTRIVGLVNAKDVFREYRRTGTVALRNVLRPVTPLAPEARVEEQLHEFRAHRLHMAIVQDGDVPLGIVTLEDILEEVVGEIEDEHDRAAPPAAPRPGASPT